MSPPVSRHHWSRAPAVDARDEHGLGLLGHDSCLELLGHQPIGRLGFSAGGLPVIHPINYILNDHTIVFRSESGQKTRAAEQGAVACLQIDHFDLLEHRGWSVLATGRLALAPFDRAEVLAHLPLTAWALGQADWFIEMPIEMLTGRSIGPPVGHG